MTATVKIDDRDLREAIRKVSFAIDDMTPVFADIAGAMQEAAEDSLANEESPSGEKWARLSNTTKDDRERQGYGRDGPILQRTGRLVGSIVAEWGQDFARAGTNVAYATTLFYGAKKGEFGTGSRGTPIPFGDIPAREFLGISDEQASDFLSRVHQHVLRGAR